MKKARQIRVPRPSAKAAPRLSAKAARFETTAAAFEQDWLHNDSRVILRRRDVLNYELTATEEHLSALQASIASVTAKKERLEALVAGLTRVLARR